MPHKYGDQVTKDYLIRFPTALYRAVRIASAKACVPMSDFILGACQAAISGKPGPLASRHDPVLHPSPTPPTAPPRPKARI